MGEVWRARDTALDRDVAIKVLSPDYARDRDRLRRFEQEARAAGQLNHQNVLTVFAVGTVGDAPYLVTELLEGETLQQRLLRGPVPARKAVDIAAQIARGLAAAHERGIIHRDLKPANIFVTNDGRVKILDFGIAKLTRSSNAPIDETRTAPGTVLGSVGYMAPEQIRGEATDGRSDLFSLGAVLYETLAGRRAFDRPSAVETLNAIVHEDVVPLQDVAPSLSRIVLRCLEKNPLERFQSARDLAFHLESAGLSTETTGNASGHGLLRRAWTRRALTQVLPWTVAVVSMAALFVAPSRSSRVATDTPSPGPERRFAIGLTETPLDGMERSPLAVSSDGGWLAYVVRDRRGVHIQLRTLGDLTAHAVGGTDDGVAPFFSPDGKNLAFFTPAGLMRISLSGGPARRVTTTPPPTRGGVWTPDNVIYFAATQHGGIYRVGADGGTADPVTEADALNNHEAHVWPDVSPDGSVLIYVARGGDSFDEARIVARSLRTGKQRSIIDGGTFARFAPSGRLVFARGTTLFAASFDVVTLSLQGTPVPVVDGVQIDPHSGASYYAIGRDGTLAYAPGDGRPPGRVLLWVTPDGTEARAFPDERPFSYPAISPDGRTVIVTIEGPHQDLWGFDTRRPVLTRLTSSPTEDFCAIWSRDGTRLAYTSIPFGEHPEVFVKPAGVLDGATRLSEMEAAFPNAWMPDNTTVLATVEPLAGRMLPQLVAMPLTGSPRPFAPWPYDRYAASLSADGKYVAFVSLENRQPEVFVAPLSDIAHPVQVSVAGGTSPIWSRTASRLFYRSSDAVEAVDVATGPVLSATPPRVLFRGQFDERARPDWPRNYDVAPDGRFLLIRETYTPSAPEVVVVLNWRGQEIARR
jgi:Tol biopolymer transport system component